MEPKRVAKKEERAHEGKPYWRIQTEGEGGKGGIWLSCWDKTIADKCIVGAVLEMEWESKLSKDGKYTNNTLTQAEPYGGTMPEPAPAKAQGGQSAPITPDTMAEWTAKDAQEHRRAIINTMIMSGRQPLLDGKDNLLFWREAGLLWAWVQKGPQKKVEELFPDA